MIPLRPSRLLAPLVPVYAAAVAASGFAYTRGWLRQQCLEAPVVSVGNLSTGGTGKTPFVICLARLLMANGYTVDVLSRGYGRRSRGVERVDPTSADAALYGDEPLLIAQTAGAPVYVGRSRYAAGRLSEADRAAASTPRGEHDRLPGRHIHLLDDGFQHRQLARSVDIVLLHPSQAADWLLPAGALREPLTALRRAHIAVLRADDSTTEAMLRDRGLLLPVWRVAREIVLPSSWAAKRCMESLSREPGVLVAASTLLPGSGAIRVVAFCGIARPSEFFAALEQTGLQPAAKVAFADHHAYSAREIETLASHARRHGATHLLTTEKDWVRLPEAARTRLQQVAPLLPVPLRTRLLGEDAALEQLITLAGQKPRGC